MAEPQTSEQWNAIWEAISRNRERLDAFAGVLERALRHGVAEHARSDRVALGVVAVEQAFR